MTEPTQPAPPAPIGPRIDFHITLWPETGRVDARASPPGSDLLVLCQAMLGITSTYIAQVQQAASMLVGRRPSPGDDGAGGGGKDAA